MQSAESAGDICSSGNPVTALRNVSSFQVANVESHSLCLPRTERLGTAFILVKTDISGNIKVRLICRSYTQQNVSRNAQGAAMSVFVHDDSYPLAFMATPTERSLQAPEAMQDLVSRQWSMNTSLCVNHKEHHTLCRSEMTSKRSSQPGAAHVHSHQYPLISICNVHTGPSPLIRSADMSSFVHVEADLDA